MNVIVICVDTLRWDYLGCYGKNKWIQTPLIDSYALKATRFNAAFCGSFPTVPMRVDAYTGDVNWPRYGWKGPDSEQKTLPAILRENEYYTALILDTRNNVGAGLHEFYDEYHLIDKPPTSTVKPEHIEFPFPRENVRQNGRGYARDMAWTAHYQYETDWFVARTMLRACKWLEENAERDSFFLWVDTFEPHEVWNAPGYYTEMYSSDYKGTDYSYPNYGHTDIYQPHEIQRLISRYAGEVTLTDRWVGHLLRQIEYMGLFEDTTVILTSDHGMYLGEHSRMGKHTVDYTDPWPLLDEVARVPLLVWSPWTEAPHITHALVQPADLMPSVLEICGISSEAPYGRSLLPILRGEAEDHWEHIFSSYFSWEGAGRIEYLRSQITVTTRNWSLVVGPPPYKAQLFDRRTDPDQKRDCAEAYSGVVEQLCSILADFMAERGAKQEYILAFTGNRASRKPKI